MIHLGYSILQCLLAHSTEPIEYKPGMHGLRTIDLALEPEDDSPLAQDLLRALQVYRRYMRGAAKALRTDSLTTDQQYRLKADLQGLLGLLEKVRGVLRAKKGEPATPWIRALLALPAGIDAGTRLALLRPALRRRAVDCEQRAPISLTVELKLAQAGPGFDLLIHLREGNLFYTESASLCDDGADVQNGSLGAELDSIIRTRREGINCIERIMAQYNAGAIFPSEMRERQDLADARALARRLTAGLSDREKSLLKSRPHLLSGLL